MTGQHRRVDGHRGAELEVVEHDVVETASWVKRNPQTVAYAWHLLMGVGVVSAWVNVHSEQLRITLTALGVLVSALAHTVAVDRSTSTADPHAADGTPLVPEVDDEAPASSASSAS